MNPTAAKTDSSFLTEQRWDDYTNEQHRVWQLLYERRMDELPDTGARLFLEGVSRIGLDATRVPRMASVNRQLAERTGWSAVPVSGFVPAPVFFQCLAARDFPTTVTVRPMDKLEYLTEPDIFHDVFRHVPLHADPVFADFLQRFGALAAQSRDERETQEMARLFWFTVEFGLIEEAAGTRVYGSGLISSSADAANALGPRCRRRPFEIDAVINQPFEIDRLQDTLFVIEGFRQLFAAVTELATRRGAGRP